MAEASITLTVDTSRLRAFADEIGPVMVRLVQHIDGANPDTPTARLVTAFEDLFEHLVDSGLWIMVYTVEGKSGLLDVTASPVMQRFADLMAAVCDGLDARRARGQA